MMCKGSYADDGVPGTYRFGKSRVTAECPECHTRVSLITAHELPNRPRLLGCHEAPPDLLLLTRAHETGKMAFAKGLSRVPALDPEVTSIIRTFPDNPKIVNRALTAWLRGWDEANLHGAG